MREACSGFEEEPDSALVVAEFAELELIVFRRRRRRRRRRRLLVIVLKFLKKKEIIPYITSAC